MFQKEKQKALEKTMPKPEGETASPETKKQEQTQNAQPQNESKKTAVKPKKLLHPGAIFGELSLITQKKWRHANIYALEESSIISFSNLQINKIVKVIFDAFYQI